MFDTILTTGVHKNGVNRRRNPCGTEKETNRKTLTSFKCNFSKHVEIAYFQHFIKRVKETLG